MRRALIALAAAVVALPAVAQETARSARWYAENHVARNAILDICRNYPGQAERNDNCKAAFEGVGIAAEREANLKLGRISPETTRYWTLRPAERWEHLANCDRMPPEWGARQQCSQARAAEEQARREADLQAQRNIPQSQPTRTARRT